MANKADVYLQILGHNWAKFWGNVPKHNRGFQKHNRDMPSCYTIQQVIAIIN